jgi:lysyl-tRNA synthetase class 2
MNDWRASSPVTVARHRAEMLARARAYFAEQQVLAVDTPALSRFANTDPNIDSFSAHSATGNQYFLHTSPEFCMKRLLADGYPDIFSICRVFRDGEIGQYHLPEFTMLEWYRLDFELGEIIADTTALIAACIGHPSLHEDAVVVEYREAFRNIAGIDIFSATIDDFANTVSADDALRDSIGRDHHVWLDLILSTVVAPSFNPDQLTVVQHYPASQAALARICPDDDRFADRFEVFHGVTELANGYVELTNADEQRRRFDQELKTRKNAGQPRLPPDEQLLAALDNGLPDCAGVALGLERLQMILMQADNIDNVVTFSSRTRHE